ncbi:hypothetical protein PG996_010677 [Apiospora saccharicola]|uniref:Rhodopsin domain-containing protein n=1 Tax=Apiospora saccharicola TaxID=335842 RepID=A0ABR1UP96_9PEZI
MLAMGGDAPLAMTFVWIMFGILTLFVLLRLYTRAVLLAALGLDDYLYFLAYIFVGLSGALLQISAEFGWGQTLQSMIMSGRAADIAPAVRWLIIASTVSTVTMVLAKVSLGLLLLRLMAVTMRWQRITIWVMLVLMVLLSLKTDLETSPPHKVQVFVFWLACHPASYLWDRQQEGYCSDIIQVYPYILYLDLAFAILPWTFIPQLQMPKAEKYLVAGTMSLGILAAASGIKRTIEVEGFWGADILAGSVQTVMWSTVEVDLTLLCIAVPVIIPLFRTCLASGRQHYSRRSKRSRSQGYQKHHSHDKSGNSGRSEDQQQLALRTIGGSEFKPNNSSSGSGGYSIAKTNSETRTTESSARADSPV